MTANKRLKILAGNWKMNKTRDQALEFIYEVNDKVSKNNEFETIIFAPTLCLRSLVKRKKDIQIGAQNMHYLDQGAYTGEISALMLTNIGVDNILIGHSERREYFNEKDGDVNLKIKQTLKHNLKPMVCIGENQKVNEQGLTNQHLEKQIKIAFMGVEPQDVKKIVIAYEPIWAIGSGKTPEPSEANETIIFIRNVIKNLYSKKEADQIRILYGGSVKPANLRDFLKESDIDGALVGGASLDSESFLNLAKCYLPL